MQGVPDMIHEDTIAVPGAVTSVGPARDFVRRALGSSAPAPVDPNRVDDIVLVTSELVTNAIENGTGGDVDIAVAFSDGRIELTVASVSTGLPSPTDELPPVDALRGRGLFIVAAISDDVAFERDGDVTRVTCVFDS